MKWFQIPEPTPDEQLVKELKRKVSEINEIGTKLRQRGISVWLKDKSSTKIGFIKPEYLFFDEAYKMHRQDFV